MKIAFISFEFPPETGPGGIATYVLNAARMLADRGHHVEVFSGTSGSTKTVVEGTITVHRVFAQQFSDFAQQVASVFAVHHNMIGFDVVEGPDYMADARFVAEQNPSIPLVIRLHTPHSWLVAVRNAFPERPVPRTSAELETDFEFQHVLDADELVTPSLALGNALSKFWGLELSRFVHIPNPYAASAFLRIPIPIEPHNRITYLGLLSINKGATVMAEAVPLILRKHPDVRIRFVGEPKPSPVEGEDMRQYLKRELHPWGNSIEILDAVALEEVANVMAETDICVIPSLWENFPNVCLEAMASGRGIVASDRGGMPEMLDFGAVGEVVVPEASEVAEGVIRLLDDPERRRRKGQLARDRFLKYYHPDSIALLQEASYERAVRRRAANGPRQPR